MATRKRTETPGLKPKRKRSDDQRELLERWRARVRRAQKIRTEWEQTFQVESLERFFLGLQQTTESRGRVFNHLWATIKTQRPNLFFVKPKFFTRPKPGRSSPADERHAAIGEASLDAIAGQDQNLKRAGSLAILQNFFRIGVLKCVYDPRLEPNPSAGEPIFLTNDAGEAIRRPTGIGPDGQMVLGDPIKLTDPKTGEELVEPDEVLSDEVYRWEWVDAKHMLLPDDGPDQSKWTWIGEEIVVPFEDAETDLRFPAHLRKRMTPNETALGAGQKPEKQSTSSADKEFDRLRYFHVFDRRKKRQAIWVDGQDFDDFLVEEPIPPGIEDHPYAVLQGWTVILGPDPLPWPLPHVRSWLDVQDEYNIRRRQITEGAKRSARKIFYDDTTFPDPDEARRSLESPKDMEAIRVTDISRLPVVVQDPPLPPDIFRDIPLLFNDWRIITGQTGARLADPDAETATEATFVERAGNLRDADMQDSINDWLSIAGQKMLQLVQATLTLSLWVKMRGYNDKEFLSYVERQYGIPGEAIQFFPGLKEIFMERFGQEKWVQVTRERLQFEVEVSVVPGSSRPRNLEVERQQWLTFLRLIGQFPQLALSRELLRETAAKFEFIPERMLDELHALALKMVQINATQAGRTQGAEGPPEAQQNAFSGLSNLLAAATAGRQQ